MQRPLGTALGIGALLLLVAGVVATGLWIGRLAGERLTPAATPPAVATAAPAAVPRDVVPTPPTPPAPQFVNTLPYRPATPLTTIGPFRLTDHQRQPIMNISLTGHYSLVVFGYTNCVEVCAFTLNNLSYALFELGVAADAIHVYFISVDAKRATRPVMAEYMTDLHPNMRGLVGTEEQVEAAMAAFGAERVVHPPTTPEGNDYVIDHTAVVFFLARDGSPKLTFAEGLPAYEIARLIRNNW